MNNDNDYFNLDRNINYNNYDLNNEQERLNNNNNIRERDINRQNHNREVNESDKNAKLNNNINNINNKNNLINQNNIYNNNNNNNNNLNHLPQYNVYAGREDRIIENLKENNNDVPDSSNLQNAVLQRIEYDMSNTKKEVRLKLADKVQMELIRRWEVKIFNIYITPYSEDKLDPFIQFTIGGDYAVSVIKDKKGKTLKRPTGERGFSNKTEVQSLVDTLERRPFESNITTEVRMSYSMINNQKLMVELWDHSSFFMNTIMGYSTCNLIDIVNGNVNMSLDIVKRTDKKKRPKLQATVEFKILFQEIWDYKITFLNVKLENILSSKQQRSNKSPIPTLQLSIELEDGNEANFLNLKKSANKLIKSEKVAGSISPQFSDFDGVLLYRGTSSNFESQNLLIKLMSYSNLFSRVLSTKVVNLQGIFEFERIKSDFPMIDEKNNEKYNIKFEASMKIEEDTKFKQKGDNTTIYSTKKYLCIDIKRVENIRPAEKRGIVDSFISIEYTGISQRTRTVKENNSPAFNETLYFLCPIKEEHLKDINKNVQKINEQFAKNNEVVFNLMIEGDDGTYDNLGMATFHLSDLKAEGNLQQRKAYADDLKKDIKYMSRIYTGKLKLVSAFSLSNTTYVNFDAWFLSDFPDTVDFGEKKSKKDMGDKIPVELGYNLKNTKETDMFYEMFKKSIVDAFRQYVNYSYKDRSFLEVYQMDQYKNNHLLPYYLSSISLPIKNFTISEVEFNPLFHNYNLTTLDEIAHFVRCFPINLEQTENVWSSPDYVIKIRKGSLEDHSILMACLMLGLKKTKVFDFQTNNYNNLNYENTTTNNLNQENKYNNINRANVNNIISNINNHQINKVEELDNNDNNNSERLEILDNSPLLKKNNGLDSHINKELIQMPISSNKLLNNETSNKNKNLNKFSSETVISDIFPYENKVFVCIGRLKTTKRRHTWVMTVGDDYKDITFWDPMMPYKFNLFGRVSDPDKLKNFLNMKYSDYNAIRAKQIINEEDIEGSKLDESNFKNDASDYENRIIPYINDSAIVGYEKDEIDDYKDGVLNETDIIVDNITNKKNKGKALEFLIDDKILSKNEEGEEDIKKGNFLKEENRKMEEELNNDSKRFFLPVDEFKDRSGKLVAPVNLPYETIDVIHLNIILYLLSLLC